MRKHLVWVLAIAILAATAAIAFGDTDNQSTVSMKVSPSKLSKKTFKPAALQIETTTEVAGDPNPATDPSLWPVPTDKVVLKFDDDIKFNPKAKGLKGKCTQDKLSAQTTADGAKAACNGDLVGTGSATGCANLGGGTCAPVGTSPHGGGIATDVLAFNGGQKSKTTASFLLWTNNAVSGTLVLPAVLKQGGSGDYGSSLIVTVPPVGGGAGSLTEFKTKVKYKNYISARCHDKNKQLNVQATFEYGKFPPPTGTIGTGGGSDKVSDSSKCST